jgi:threonine/homoserine/homoserine lactone efflux protein
MPHLSQLTLFITGTIVIVVIPGPNILYLIARSIHQGRMAGLASVLGIEAATIIHICAATLGLTSVLLSSALAFNVVKYLGAAYLVYLGIRKLLVREEADKSTIEPQGALQQVFVQGFLVNLLNPKTSLFFFAFLPQFVDPGNGSVPVQIASLGLVLVLLATIIEVAYVLLASRLRTWLKGSEAFARRQRYFAGSAYVGLGLATALSGSRHS